MKDAITANPIERLAKRLAEDQTLEVELRLVRRGPPLPGDPDEIPERVSIRRMRVFAHPAVEDMRTLLSYALIRLADTPNKPEEGFIVPVYAEDKSSE